MGDNDNDNHDRSEMTLLIADDHPIFRQGLRHIVERVPNLRVVAEADSGDAALNQIRYLDPDMVILDLAMPGMDGLQVMERLRDQDRQPAVIIVTAFDDQAYLDRAMELGARAYVLKDSAGDDMASCLENVRRGERYITPSLGSHTPIKPAANGLDLEALQTLTAMERTVLQKVAQFKTSKEIAGELGVSYRTVQNHRSNICDKLQLRGVHQLLAFARDHNELLKD